MSQIRTTPPDVSALRHTCAHLLAAAVLRLWPDTKCTIGPAIENGFYYDFEFGHTPSVDDLPTIEREMRNILPSWTSAAHREVTKDEALLSFAGNPYKQELIEEIASRGEPITLYTWGEFEDLCRGGHVDDAHEILPDGFTLSRIAGAYWRGDEKNPMLTRIYGIAFPTHDELAKHCEMLREAEKRDHRKLGKELSLFVFDDEVGPGLPLWLPNGALIIEELESLAKEEEAKAGYVRVRTPHIAKQSLYHTSGHLPFYQDSMFPPMESEGEVYYLKAMNCPHHHKIFAAQKRSYRELPLRLAEYGTCYRFEKSGELFGLMRVRSLQMNDAHIYCTREQFADEFRAVNELYLTYFKLFGIEKYVMRFSTHVAEKLGEKYVNEPELWKQTETMVRDVLISSKIPYVEVSDEAAFYGPKIDVQVYSAIGREFTLATNQVDFAVPARFGLTYTSPQGTEETPLCIHRAPLGTHERFIGFLIEHFAGRFPLWLSPVQVKVLSVGESHMSYARALSDEFCSVKIRCMLDDSADTVGAKIRRAELEKTPYTIVIGDREMNEGKLSVRIRGEKDLLTCTKEEFTTRIRENLTLRLLDL